MGNTFASLLEALSSSPSTKIINQAYLQAMLRISKDLPVFKKGFFEFWFDDSKERVDLNICIDLLAGEHSKALKHFYHQSLQTPPLYPVSGDILFFLKKWASDRFVIKRQVRQLWLIYDIEDPADKTFAPWCYVVFQPQIVSVNAAYKARIVMHTLAYFQTSFSESFKDHLLTTFTQIPKYTFLSAVGIQTNRGITALRAYLPFKSINQIYAFLDAFDWPGSTLELEKALVGLTADCQVFGLAIDLNPAVQARIGIEFWFLEENGFEKLNRLLLKLEKRGHCSPQKITAYLDWNSTLITNGAIPGPGSSGSTSQIQYSVNRSSRYIKIIYEPDGAPVVKGYMGYDISPADSVYS